MEKKKKTRWWIRLGKLTQYDENSEMKVSWTMKEHTG